MNRERAWGLSDAHLFYVMKARLSAVRANSSTRFARACVACNLSVVGPRASLCAPPTGCRREVKGRSSIIGITGLPRAFSCLFGSARRRSAGFVHRRQSRSSSRAIRTFFAFRTAFSAISTESAVIARNRGEIQPSIYLRRVSVLSRVRSFAV